MSSALIHRLRRATKEEKKNIDIVTKRKERKKKTSIITTTKEMKNEHRLMTTS